VIHSYIIYLRKDLIYSWKESNLNRVCDMTETLVESIFGVNAGIVWNSLSQNGPSTIEDIVKTTSLSREEVHGALGWLGRENKILVEIRGKARGRKTKVFSLVQ
jgi:hypothetical protein